MMAAFVLIKSARDALFFSSGGIEALPQAILGIATLALPFALVTAGFMRWVGARRARVGMPALAATVFLLAPRLMAGADGMRTTLLFMLVPLLFGVMFSLAWLLAGELFEGALHEDQVEAYRWIGAASILGGALGGLTGRMLATSWGPNVLMAAGSAVLLGSAAVMAWAQRRFTARPAATPPATLLAVALDVRRVAGQSYVRRLLAVAMAGAFAGVLVEFFFYTVAASSPRSAGGNARFFASAYFVMHAGALLLQLGVYRRLHQRVGVTGLLMTLPIVLFGGSLGLLLGAGMMMIGPAMRIADGGVKQSLHRSSWERSFLPVPRADRGLAKLMVDGAGARIAEGVAALLLVLWIRYGLRGQAPGPRESLPIAAGIVTASLVWLGFARSMRRELRRHAEANPEDRCRPDSPLPDG